MHASAVAAVVSLSAALTLAIPAQADPTSCNDAFCTPGITPNVVLGAPCADTAYYVFGTAVAGPSIQPGRLVFCGSPRRYEPRYFRSPQMAGIKELGANCSGFERWVAQAPDGLFLICQSQDGEPKWRRGDDK